MESTDISPIIQSQAESLRTMRVTYKVYSVVGKGFWGYIKNVLPLSRTMNHDRYDIIHAHYSLCGIVSFMAAMRFLKSGTSRPPVVVSLMGSDVKSGGIWLHVVRFFVSKAWNATIVKSSDMKQSLGLNSSVIIPNGVNFEVFRSLSPTECKQDLEWNQNTKYILFGADPSRKVKNYSLAEQSFKLLSKKNCKLMSLGAIPHADVPIYLNACDALLLTSKWEGSPNIVKEAMACGTPIVCTDAGDVRWLLEGLDGCFVTSHNPEDIASKLELALQFEGKTKGRERLIELKLDSESVAKRIVEVYEGVLRKRGRDGVTERKRD